MEMLFNQHLFWKLLMNPVINFHTMVHLLCGLFPSSHYNTLWNLAAHTKRNPCHHVQSADITTLLEKSYVSTLSFILHHQEMPSFAKPLLMLNWLKCIQQSWNLSARKCMLIYTVSAGKGSSELKNEFPLHTQAEHCGTMTERLSWWMKSKVVARVMSCFKAPDGGQRTPVSWIWIRWMKRFCWSECQSLNSVELLLSIPRLTLIHFEKLALAEFVKNRRMIHFQCFCRHDRNLTFSSCAETAILPQKAEHIKKNI